MASLIRTRLNNIFKIFSGTTQICMLVSPFVWIQQFCHQSCCDNPLFGNFSIQPAVWFHQFCHQSCCRNPWVCIIKMVSLTPFLLNTPRSLIFWKIYFALSKFWLDFAMMTLKSGKRLLTGLKPDSLVFLAIFLSSSHQKLNFKSILLSFSYLRDLQRYNIKSIFIGKLI